MSAAKVRVLAAALLAAAAAGRLRAQPLPPPVASYQITCRLDADKKTVWDIAAETQNMVELARQGKLRASLQMGAGFTVSNIGPVGIDAFNAIISPPQTAILAVGSMALRPVVDRGREWRPGQPFDGFAVVAAPTMNLVLTVDHRVVDGAEAAPFLKDLRDKLETWES